MQASCTHLPLDCKTILNDVCNLVCSVFQQLFYISSVLMSIRCPIAILYFSQIDVSTSLVAVGGLSSPTHMLGFKYMMPSEFLVMSFIGILTLSSSCSYVGVRRPKNYSTVAFFPFLICSVIGNIHRKFNFAFVLCIAFSRFWEKNCLHLKFLYCFLKHCFFLLVFFIQVLY